MYRTISLLLLGLSVVCGLPEPEAGQSSGQINTLIRVKRAGACTTTADCVAGNVCSKWGWCQWTNIYGEDGPSQGASAPAGGRAGQCVTSADCASRVPYCSDLGYCHGGRLPFDEAQLEIPDEDKQGDNQPQGFINNNPRKNNPALKSGGGSKKSGGGSAGSARSGGGGGSYTPKRTSRKSAGTTKNNNARRGNNNKNNTNNNRRNRNSNRSKAAGKQTLRNNISRPKQSNSGRGSKKCPGGSLDACVDSCIPIKQVRAYGVCVKECGARC